MESTDGGSYDLGCMKWLILTASSSNALRPMQLNCNTRLSLQEQSSVRFYFCFRSYFDLSLNYNTRPSSLAFVSPFLLQLYVPKRPGELEVLPLGVGANPISGVNPFNLNSILM